VALVSFCEQFELDMGHTDLAPAASLGVYKMHLAAYLMCERLEDARFLWKRVPAEARDPELVALWEIGKAMWGKDIAAAQAAMVAHAWTQPLLSALLERMQRTHLERSFAQCARAYSQVSAEHLARTLGARGRRSCSARRSSARPPSLLRRCALPPPAHRASLLLSPSPLCSCALPRSIPS
jgi:hypothetical protein